MTRAVLFSRILSVLGAFAAAGVVLWFISTSFAPVEVPPAPVRARSAIHFDANADVSKNQAFRALLPSPVTTTVPATVGRENPFYPPEFVAERLNAVEPSVQRELPMQTVIPFAPQEIPTTTATTTLELMIQ